MKGLEPPRLSALDPKSSAATNYATSAWFFFEGAKIHFFNRKILFSCQNIKKPFIKNGFRVKFLHPTRREVRFRPT